MPVQLPELFEWYFLRVPIEEGHVHCSGKSLSRWPTPCHWIGATSVPWNGHHADFTNFLQRGAVCGDNAGQVLSRKAIGRGNSEPSDPVGQQRRKRRLLNACLIAK